MKEKVGVGIIGTGFARKVQIPAFVACENAEVVSVSSGSLENARATAEEFGIQHFTDDWRETVSRDDVDLVCVTTPPNLHKEMTLFALEHGKHVLCEKPMAMSVAEAEEMVAAANKAGVLALIDFELRFQPGRQKAYAMIRNGEIGKIRHAKWNFRAPHRGDPNLPWNWWSDIEHGGGALGAINSHIIDSFNWFLGADVSSVFCQLQTHVKRRPLADGGYSRRNDRRRSEYAAEICGRRIDRRRDRARLGVDGRTAGVRKPDRVVRYGRSHQDRSPRRPVYRKKR